MYRIMKQVITMWDAQGKTIKNKQHDNKIEHKKIVWPLGGVIKWVKMYSQWIGHLLF